MDGSWTGNEQVGNGKPLGVNTPAPIPKTLYSQLYQQLMIFPDKLPQVAVYTRYSFSAERAAS